MAELETQLIIAVEIGYIGKDKLNSIMDLSAEIGRMLNGMQRTLKEKLNAEC